MPPVPVEQLQCPTRPPPLPLHTGSPFDPFLPSPTTSQLPAAALPHLSNAASKLGQGTVINPINSSVTINLVTPAATSPDISGMSAAASAADTAATTSPVPCDVPVAPPGPFASVSSSGAFNVSVGTPTACALPFPVLPSSAPTTVAAETPEARKWNELLGRYPHWQARLQQHPEWTFEGSQWVPVYRFQPVNAIMDIWTEFAEGIGAYLPVRFMNEVWGAKWKRNTASIKTSASRRMRVVELIQKLEKRHRWDIHLALKFIHEKYEPRYTPRGFSGALEGKKGAVFAEGVMAAADAYLSG
ncbi:hypothetical protein K474DRAFT_261911 [Panus rudis PR-1116 ss-1]|nr:hypothetical protein K474DRAFT_261911 [Panus rudis PR-1116 ss-1]